MSAMGGIEVGVLVENTANRRGVLGEHGLSFHVRRGDGAMLFDTGQSPLLAANARALGIDLARVNAVALSHGHYDHTGGLVTAWKIAPGATLHAHPAALGPHRARNPDGTTRDVGIGAGALGAIRERGAAADLRTGPVEVLPGLFLTGEIPRETGWEDVGGPFVLDEAGAVPDPIADDQALVIDAREGLVILLGCAHAGVVNTLRHIRGLFGARPIRAVLGGMHLLRANEERLARTVEELRALGVRTLGPAHCTGADAAARLRVEFPGACVACSVGDRFAFG